MPEAYSVVVIKAEITKIAAKLFSEGSLSDKAALSLTLSEMAGLDLFSTVVPWQIDIPQHDPIAGFSETLRAAAKDIHAQLMTLKRTLSLNTDVKIGIDETRLPHQRQSTVPLKKLRKNRE